MPDASGGRSGYSLEDTQVDAIASVVGLAAASFTTIANLPQVVKCLRTGSSDDLSLRMLLALCTGFGLWVFYGLFRTDLIIIIANAVSLTLAGILLAHKLLTPRP